MELLPNLKEMLGNKEIFMESQNQKYIDQNIHVLEEIYARSGEMRTDDPDEFENWMAQHEQVQLVAMIDNVKSQGVKE